MRRGTLFLILFAAIHFACCSPAYALDTNLAFRIGCEVQTAGMQSLPDLTWVQGSTPLIEAQILRNGRQVSLSTNVRARMLISSNLYAATSWAVATNTVLTTNAAAASMWIQWGEVGTNSCAAGTNEPSAWGYTMFFEDAVTGTRYWNGAGRLYVEKSTATGNGLTWLNPTSLTSIVWGQIFGEPADNAGLVAYVAASAGADTIARAGVASNAASIAAVGAVASNALPAITSAVYVVGASGEVTQWGSDAANAIRSMSENDTAHVSEGDFSLGTNQYIIPSGASIAGAGMYKTRLTSEIGSIDPNTTVQCLFLCTSNNTFSDFSASAPAATTNSYSSIFGDHSEYFTGTEIRRVYAFSRSDCLFMGYSGTNGVGYSRRLTATDSHFESKFDAAVIRPAGEYVFENCTFESLGPNEYTGSQREAGIMLGSLLMPGQYDVRLQDCTVIARDGQNGVYGIGIYATGATVRIESTAFDVSGTAVVWQVHGVQGSTYISGGNVETNKVYGNATIRETSIVQAVQAASTTNDFPLIDFGAGSGIDASTATNIAQAVVAEATTNDMPGIDWASLGGSGGGTSTNETDPTAYAKIAEPYRAFSAIVPVEAAGSNVYAVTAAGGNMVKLDGIGGTNAAWITFTEAGYGTDGVSRVWMQLTTTGTNNVSFDGATTDGSSFFDVAYPSTNQILWTRTGAGKFVGFQHYGAE